MINNASIYNFWTDCPGDSAGEYYFTDFITSEQTALLIQLESITLLILLLQLTTMMIQ